MESDLYYTISKPAEGYYKEKGSKFFSFAFPVKTEEEIKILRQQLLRQYHDARHICFAYRIGPDSNNFKINDDGEPSGTAGKPIYGQILSYNLTNVVIFVVRYFGGVLLGTSGLIKAYREAANNAIINADIISSTWNDIYSLSFSYYNLNDVMKIIKNENIITFENKFENNCFLKIKVRKKDSEKIFNIFKKINGLTIEYLESE
jgi:uncharacterized YigZ family protein